MNILQKIQEINQNRSNLILKAFGIEDSIEKARAGTYENTPENRKLGRVGQKYGSKKEDGEEIIFDKNKSIRENNLKIVSLINNILIKNYNKLPLNITINKALTTDSVYIKIGEKESSQDFIIRISDHESNKYNQGFRDAGGKIIKEPDLNLYFDKNGKFKISEKELFKNITKDYYISSFISEETLNDKNLTENDVDNYIENKIK